MRNSARPRDRRRGRGRRWAVLALLGFAAGVLFVGVAVLLPGPERKEEGLSPFSAPPPREEAKPGPAAPAGPAAPPRRLAIVVDDLGYDPPRDAEWLSFPAKITLAVIPFGPSSRRIAEAARDRGFGVLIHVPMEPEGDAPDRTEGFRLARGMDAPQIEARLARMAEDVPGAAGISNHMGSAMTSDPAAMEVLMEVLRARGLFFVDSLTSSRSVGYETALRAGVPAVRRDLFLDAEGGEEQMRRQWEKAVALAAERGRAVVVCHARPRSLDLLRSLLPALGKAGVQAVTVDELLDRGGG